MKMIKLIFAGIMIALAAPGAARAAYTCTLKYTSCNDGYQLEGDNCKVRSCPSNSYVNESENTCSLCSLLGDFYTGWGAGMGSGGPETCCAQLTNDKYVASKNAKTTTTCGDGWYKANHQYCYNDSNESCYQCVKPDRIATLTWTSNGRGLGETGCTYTVLTCSAGYYKSDNDCKSCTNVAPMPADAQIRIPVYTGPGTTATNCPVVAWITQCQNGYYRSIGGDGPTPEQLANNDLNSCFACPPNSSVDPDNDTQCKCRVGYRNPTDGAEYVDANKSCEIAKYNITYSCGSIGYSRSGQNQIIKIKDGGISGDPPAVQKQLYDQSVLLDITFPCQKNGYVQKGWAKCNTCSDNDTPAVISGWAGNKDINLYPYFELKKITCTPGNYLPLNSETCSPCGEAATGYYCVGGEYWFNSISDQGRAECPVDGMITDFDNATSINQCKCSDYITQDFYIDGLIPGAVGQKVSGQCVPSAQLSSSNACRAACSPVILTKKGQPGKCSDGKDLPCVPPLQASVADNGKNGIGINGFTNSGITGQTISFSNTAIGYCESDSTHEPLGNSFNIELIPDKVQLSQSGQ